MTYFFPKQLALDNVAPDDSCAGCGYIFSHTAKEIAKQFSLDQDMLERLVGVTLYDASGDRINTSKPQTVSGKPFRVPFHCTKSNSKE